MYINDRRVRQRMVKRRKGVLSGLGGASDCGADQVWCPSYVFNGLPPGQCVTQDQCNQWNAAHPAPQQSGTSSGSVWGDIAGSLLKGFVGSQQPAQPAMVVQSGPSTGTIIAIGAAGLLGVYLLTRK